MPPPLHHSPVFDVDSLMPPPLHSSPILSSHSAVSCHHPCIHLLYSLSAALCYHPCIHLLSSHSTASCTCHHACIHFTGLILCLVHDPPNQLLKTRFKSCGLLWLRIKVCISATTRTPSPHMAISLWILRRQLRLGYRHELEVNSGG